MPGKPWALQEGDGAKEKVMALGRSAVPATGESVSSKRSPEPLEVRLSSPRGAPRRTLDLNSALQPTRGSNPKTQQHPGVLEEGSPG